MHEKLQAVTEQAEQDLSQNASQDVTEGKNPQDQANPAEAAQAIAELDKMDKFKLDGQEWTLKDLKAAIMRQKDYTQKTQSLAESRKSFDGERNFYENLAWDLMKLKENPSLASEFVKVYPQSFHKYAESVLNQSNQQPQGAQQQVQHQPQHDVNTLSRLERLEKFYNDQETNRYEAQIEKVVGDLSKKYPEADQEKVLARAYEAHVSKTELNDQLWEDFFKQSHEQELAKFTAKQKEFVKRQSEANAKARGPGDGGGVPGAAPKKFKSLKEVTDFAIDDLSGRSR